MREITEAWQEAYAAFKGAFDTPIARRRQKDEYSVDARKRLKAFDDMIAALAADAKGAGPDDAKLPCDVMVAPRTLIRKGCPVSILMLAISKRDGWDDESTRIRSAIVNPPALGAGSVDADKGATEAIVERALSVPPIEGRGPAVFDRARMHAALTAALGAGSAPDGSADLKDATRGRGE